MLGHNDSNIVLKFNAILATRAETGALGGINVPFGVHPMPAMVSEAVDEISIPGQRKLHLCVYSGHKRENRGRV